MTNDQPHKKPPTKLICVIFGLFGALLFVVGIFQLTSAITTVSSGVKAKGKIVGLAERQKRVGETVRGDLAKMPTVTFTTAEGKEITFRSSVGTSSGFSVGEEVTVLYPKDNPQAARISSFFQLWFLPLILILIGAPLALGSFLIFKFSSADLSPAGIEKKKATLSHEQRERVEKVLANLDGSN